MPLSLKTDKLEALIKELENNATSRSQRKLAQEIASQARMLINIPRESLAFSPQQGNTLKRKNKGWLKRSLLEKARVALKEEEAFSSEFHGGMAFAFREAAAMLEEAPE
jgi:hypothetical protein